jgi:hypothetical protein
MSALFGLSCVVLVEDLSILQWLSPCAVSMGLYNTVHWHHAQKISSLVSKAESSSQGIQVGSCAGMHLISKSSQDPVLGVEEWSQPW